MALAAAREDRSVAHPDDAARAVDFRADDAMPLEDAFHFVRSQALYVHIGMEIDMHDIFTKAL